MSDQDVVSSPPATQQGAVPPWGCGTAIHRCLPPFCSLQKNAIGAQGARKIAEALKQNRSLRELM